jgi:hypothetical protein
MDETGEGEFGTVACRLLLRLDPLFHFRHASYLGLSISQLASFHRKICRNLVSDVIQHRTRNT